MNGTVATAITTTTTIMRPGDRRHAADGQAAKRLQSPATPAGGAHPRPPPAGQKDRRIAELQGELDESREHLRALLHEYDSADEELRSTNEEALAANEDLRNINEELQTAKEQVQSANQELETLNQELHDGNRELGYAADDLMNLVDFLNLPMVIVGGDLTVRRFTAPAETLLNLIATDVGRPLGDLRPNVEATDLATAARGVIKTLIPVQLGVKDKQGRDYVLRIRPYRTSESKIDGAVIIFIDEAALKAT
jgi:two-component system CheB/CheR fusion protein